MQNITNVHVELIRQPKCQNWPTVPPLPPICGEKKSPKNLQNLVIPILAELKYFIVYFLGPAQILYHEFYWALLKYFIISFIGPSSDILSYVLLGPVPTQRSVSPLLLGGNDFV